MSRPEVTSSECQVCCKRAGEDPHSLGEEEKSLLIFAINGTSIIRTQQEMNQTPAESTLKC